MRDISWLDNLTDSEVNQLYVYAANLFPGKVTKDIDEIYHYCPVCQDEWAVMARCNHGRAYIEVPVLVDVPYNYAYLGWEQADVEADFEYVCSNCGTVISHSLETIQEMWKKQAYNTKEEENATVCPE
jgi:predicted RNA-binding Zn-ribbon protein involved in translation (DUF1610 family)